MEAGWKLKQRKPTVAPARMMVTVAAPTSPFKLATTNMVVRAKSAAPAARPSRPSMRLKAFVMPTNHATVKSIPMALPEIDDAHEGQRERRDAQAGDVDPAARSRPGRGTSTGRASGARRPRARRDARPAHRRGPWPSPRAFVASTCCPNRPMIAVIETATERTIATPPIRGTGLTWTFRSPHGSTRPARRANSRTTNVSADEEQTAMTSPMRYNGISGFCDNKGPGAPDAPRDARPHRVRSTVPES